MSQLVDVYTLLHFLCSKKKKQTAETLVPPEITMTVIR